MLGGDEIRHRLLLLLLLLLLFAVVVAVVVIVEVVFEEEGNIGSGRNTGTVDKEGNREGSGGLVFSVG
jgi:hypothetical protein